MVRPAVAVNVNVASWPGSVVVIETGFPSDAIVPTTSGATSKSVNVASVGMPLNVNAAKRIAYVPVAGSVVAGRG